LVKSNVIVTMLYNVPQFCHNFTNHTPPDNFCFSGRDILNFVGIFRV
jgi:hypothetical protein